MSEALKKVAPGDPLVIPAAAYNTFVDAARDYLARQQDQVQEARPSGRHSGIVLVRNDISPPQPAERFWVLSIDGPVVSPSDNLEEFKNRVVFSGAVPFISGYRGRFVVLLEPLAAGAIGLGVVSGVCPVKVYVNNENHQFADVQNDTCGYLWSGASGAAQILWKESGTGVKWAVVRLGGGQLAPEVFFGRPTSAFSSGATITLDPCDIHGTDSGQANRTVYVKADQSSYSMTNSTSIATSAIIPHVLADDGCYYMLGTPIEVVTAMQVDDANRKIQKKTRNVWVPTAGSESGWVDWYANGQECPD
jgi:hypothetical protein